jgi:D-serine deaminase-like pyridoxal phosphate-dependent protein
MNRAELSRSEAVGSGVRSVDDCETPCLLLDRGRLEANIALMAARARALGVVLRPHLKTAKSLEVAALSADPADPRITVSTLKEADYFAAAGYRDILYAVGMAPNKLAHASALRRAGVDLTLLVDNLDAARAIGEAAGRSGVGFAVMIEIDTDGHRAGLRPEDEALIELAAMIDAHPGLELRGVLTHAGGSYDRPGAAAITETAEMERAGAVRAAGRIRAAGLACREVSVGSTPTARFARSLEGVTELRAGVYMFHDLVMAGLEVCRVEDIALSVLATVIGHQPARGLVLVDAGWMALSRDRGTAGQALDQGYGAVCERTGELIAGLIVVSVNQEHGMIARRDGGPLDPAEFPVGRQLRILPNHACATAAQHGGYFLVDGASPEVLGEWGRINGW